MHFSALLEICPGQPAKYFAKLLFLRGTNYPRRLTRNRPVLRRTYVRRSASLKNFKYLWLEPRSWLIHWGHFFVRRIIIVFYGIRAFYVGRKQKGLRKDKHCYATQPFFPPRFPIRWEIRDASVMRFIRFPAAPPEFSVTLPSSSKGFFVRGIDRLISRDVGILLILPWFFQRGLKNRKDDFVSRR